MAPEDYARYRSREGKDNNLYLGEHLISTFMFHSSTNSSLSSGYSLEAYCDQPTPQHQREDRAYILAKHAKYFDPPEYKYSNHIFADMKDSEGIAFVAGSGDKNTGLPDSGITNLGQLKLPDFKREMGKSKALV